MLVLLTALIFTVILSYVWYELDDSLIKHDLVLQDVISQMKHSQVLLARGELYE